MPQRKALKRVKGGPQGEDAYIDVRKIKWGKRRDAFAPLQAVIDEQSAASEESNLDRVAELDRKALSLMAPLIESWNWVGDDDKPLPPLSQTPELIEDLYGDEVTWLVTETLRAAFGASSPKN